ncbi:hypothetical protein VKS41_000780 [Umbelopsis sp. WA50703]
MQVFKLDPDSRLTIEELKSKIIKCNQFKRKPKEQEKPETSSRLRPTFARTMPSTSQSSIQSESSWTSCHSNFSSSLSISKSSVEPHREPLDGRINENATNPNSILHVSSQKNSCPSSLQITNSTASTDSDGSECCTPETQIKDVLWNQASIKTSTAEVLPDREYLKQIYSNSPNAYYLP